MSRPPELPADVAAAVAGAQQVTVLTGAGMSAESGLATFRQPHTGLWSRFAPEELATPEAWERDAPLVWAWYSWRTALVREARPNAGHLALAEWATATRLEVVTQNVDDLHERAGTTGVLHLHGSLLVPRCSLCGEAADPEVAVGTTAPDHPERLEPPACPTCGGSVRPGVVWFGESVDAMDDAVRAVLRADLVVVVGTSGTVYPAAGLTALAVDAGIAVVEVNPEAREREGVLAWRETAARALPLLVGG